MQYIDISSLCFLARFLSPWLPHGMRRAAKACVQRRRPPSSQAEARLARDAGCSAVSPSPRCRRASRQQTDVARRIARGDD
eukprot:4942433-Prymnesium_polylepis.2